MVIILNFPEKIQKRNLLVVCTSTRCFAKFGAVVKDDLRLQKTRTDGIVDWLTDMSKLKHWSTRKLLRGV